MDSELVRPARVAESPIQLECKVLEVKELGSDGAAGNLVICELLRMHLKEEILGSDGYVDQQKIDLVARMGGSWYCRANGDALFEMQKPITSIGVGVDQLPEKIRLSSELSGNMLGILGSMTGLLSAEEIEKELITVDNTEITLDKAKSLLEEGNATLAYAILTKCL